MQSKWSSVDNDEDVDINKKRRSMIPYCGNCSRKAKKAGLANGEFFCDIIFDTPMKGIVTFDTDGARCLELGVYKPIQQKTV